MPDLLNGSKGLVGTAVALCSVGGILFHGVYDKQEMLDRAIAKVESEARAERQMMRDEFFDKTKELEAGKQVNQKAITALQAADVEIETQMRSVAIVGNMERQMQERVMDLLHQCPTCKVPERSYYPPGPGPDGKAQ